MERKDLSYNSTDQRQATSFRTYQSFFLSKRKRYLTFADRKKNVAMCEYAEIENIKLSNGKTIKQVNEEVRKEVELIYLEGWKKGIAIPFWDNKGNYYLANPDGSEDLVEFNRKERSYKVISRIAGKGEGRYAYLLDRQGE